MLHNFDLVFTSTSSTWARVSPSVLASFKTSHKSGHSYIHCLQLRAMNHSQCAKSSSMELGADAEKWALLPLLGQGEASLNSDVVDDWNWVVYIVYKIQCLFYNTVGDQRPLKLGGVWEGLRRLYGKVLWKVGDSNSIRHGVDPWVPSNSGGCLSYTQNFEI